MGSTPTASGSCASERLGPAARSSTSETRQLHIRSRTNLEKVGGKMKRVRRDDWRGQISWALVPVLVLCFFVIVLSHSDALAAGEKTLLRDVEEVVVPGSALSSFVGYPTDRIHLYRYN